MNEHQIQVAYYRDVRARIEGGYRLPPVVQRPVLRIEAPKEPEPRVLAPAENFHDAHMVSYYIHRTIAQQQFANAPLLPEKMTVKRILDAVSLVFDVPVSDLLGDRRVKKVIRPRMAAMYLAREMTTQSLADIGRRFGGRDHTTVFHAVRRIREGMLSDPELHSQITSLTTGLMPPENKLAA